MQDGFECHIELVLFEDEAFFIREVPVLRVAMSEEDRVRNAEIELRRELASFSPKTIEKPFYLAFNVIHISNCFIKI